MSKSKRSKGAKRKMPYGSVPAGGGVETPAVVTEAGASPSRPCRWWPWAVLVLVLLPVLLLLGKGWTGSSLLFGIDYSTTNAVAQRRVLDQNAWYTWMPFFRMGAPAVKLLGVSTWLLQWFDPHRFLPVNYSLMILVGGLGMYLWTRILGCSRLVAAFAAGAFMYSSGMIGYIYPGHLNRMDCAYWGPWSFFLVERARRTDRWWAHGWVGVPLALMLLAHDPQTAMYTGVWVAVYYVVGWVGEARTHAWRPGRWMVGSMGGALFGAGVALVFGLQAVLFFGWHMNAKGLGGVRTEADRWEYATQFSFPPEETVTFFTTGYLFGGASQEAYAGRVALKLHDDYMGAWVVLFAAMGLWACRRRAEARFLGVMALFSLLIAWGRFFPVYQWIYALPTMKMQRTPWRWIYLVQLAVPVLAALGMEAVRSLMARDADGRWARLRKASAGLALGAGLLFGLALIGWLDARGGQGGKASLSALRWLAVWRTAMVLFLGLGWCWLTMGMRREGRWGLARSDWFVVGLLCLTLVDLGVNARRFVQWVDRDFYRADALVEELKADPDLFRVKLGPGGSPYLNQLNTFHFRYHAVASADPPSSERVPRLYEAFLDAVQQGRIPFENYLRIFNIKYLIWPQPLPEETRPVFTPILGGQAAHLYRYERWMSRFLLVPSWEVVDGDAQLERLSDEAWDPRRRVFVSAPKAWPEGFTAGVEPGAVGPVGAVVPRRVTATVLELEVQADRSAILLLSQYYDPDWTVHLDGVPAPLLRANHLMQGVAIPPGGHRVELRHTPSMVGFRVTQASWWVVLTVLAATGIRRVRRRDAKRHPGEDRDG